MNDTATVHDAKLHQIVHILFVIHWSALAQSEATVHPVLLDLILLLVLWDPVDKPAL